MRLLHATELRFEEFSDDEIPEYAILSHRWGEDEVSYQDFLTGRGKHGLGYEKVIAFCELAAAGCPDSSRWQDFGYQVEWVWVDTCCIDKSSSAELSEAINSMYNWYANSSICFAYLADVRKSAGDWATTMAAFERSQWFRRGWTLQELLAPFTVVFFDMDWAYIGWRDELVSNISKASDIPETIVADFYSMKTVSISAAEKFAWISTRTTSRREDLAYCLMGLFDINMPLLYGEGHKAFRRIQLQILSSSNDESIFLWDIPVGLWRQQLPSLLGLLAPQTTALGPILYTRYSALPGFFPWPCVSRPPYAVTNQGLELRVPKKLASKGQFFLPLNLRYLEEESYDGVYAILLQRVDTDEEDSWLRCFPDSLPPTLPKLPRIKYQDCGRSQGLFVAPESWLWNRDQLAEMETQVIYIQL